MKRKKEFQFPSPITFYSNQKFFLQFDQDVDLGSGEIDNEVIDNGSGFDINLTDVS